MHLDLIQDHEQQASIPFQDLFKIAPNGIFEQIKDEAICAKNGEVELVSGKCFPFAYLAIAPGATQPSPAKLRGREERRVLG